MGTESLPPQGSPSTYLQVEGSVPALHVLLWGQQEDAAEAGLQESVLSFTLHNQLGSAAKAEGPVGCWARQWSCNAPGTWMQIPGPGDPAVLWRVGGGALGRHLFSL